MSIEKLNLKLVRQENKSFTTLYNSVVQNITDAFNLGVYCYLSSLPHNWVVSKKQLMNHFCVGKDKISSTMAWLNKNNLIEYIQERKEDGKMGNHIILVKDGSSFDGGKSGHRESRLPEKPLTGESAPTNIIYNTNKTKDKNKTVAQRQKRVASEPEHIVLPDWLSKELWEEFKQHRKEMKKPMSLLAQKKTISQLDKMRAGGQDIESVINQSIANGWQGLFELKSQGNVYEKCNSSAGSVRKEKFDSTQWLIDRIKSRQSREDNSHAESNLPIKNIEYLWNT